MKNRLLLETYKMFNKSQEELRKVDNDADIVIAPFDEEVVNEKAQFFPIFIFVFIHP